MNKTKEFVYHLTTAVRELDDGLNDATIVSMYLCRSATAQWNFYGTMLSRTAQTSASKRIKRTKFLI